MEGTAGKYDQTEPVVTYECADDSHTYKVSLTREAATLLSRVGRDLVHAMVKIEFSAILSDPFGAHCIDSDVVNGKPTSPVPEYARIVNRFSDATEGILGIPIAAKGSGRDEDRLHPGTYGTRIKLPQQFNLMHRVYAAQQKHYPEGIGGLFFINQPFALVEQMPSGLTASKSQYWMLMRRVIDSEPLRDKIRETRRWDRQGYADIGDYPEIDSFVRAHGKDAFQGKWILFRDHLGAILQDHFGGSIPKGTFYDLRGSNILRQTDHLGANTYTLIDLQ